MTLICSSPNAPAGVTVNPIPVNGQCTFSVTGQLPEGTHSFTLECRDDQTGELVSTCPATVSCDLIEGTEPETPTLDKDAIRECVIEQLALLTVPDRTNCCDNFALRWNSQCGDAKSWVFADWDGDRIIDMNMGIGEVTYDHLVELPNNADAECAPEFEPDGKPIPSYDFFKVARRESDGCITHLGICGEWVALTDSKAFTERVYFDAPNNYPIYLDTNTAGIEIDGEFYPLNLTCEDKVLTQCVHQIRTYRWNDQDGTPLPPQTPVLPVLTSNNIAGGDCSLAFTAPTNTAQRELVALNFEAWSPHGGTCLTQETTCMFLDFDLTSGAGTDQIGVGLTDVTSSVWSNVSVISAPPGAVAGTHYINQGDHLTINNQLPLNGHWTIKFVPQSGQPANGDIEARFWSFGSSNSEQERIEGIRLTVESNRTQPCYEVTSGGDYADLLTSVDPNGYTYSYITDAGDGQFCVNVHPSDVDIYTQAATGDSATNPGGGGGDPDPDPDPDSFCLPVPSSYPISLNSDTAGVSLNSTNFLFGGSCNTTITGPECLTSQYVYEYGNTQGTPLPPPTSQLTNLLADIAPGPDEGCNWGVFSLGPIELHGIGFDLYEPHGGTCNTRDIECVWLDFDVTTTGGDKFGVGLRDRTSQVWMNMVTITPPAGSVPVTDYQGHGDHLTIKTGSSPIGHWRIKYVPQSIQPANGDIEAVFWSIGSDVCGLQREIIENITQTVECSDPEPCLTIASGQEYADMITAALPTPDQFTYSNGQICTTTNTTAYNDLTLLQ